MSEPGVDPVIAPIDRLEDRICDARFAARDLGVLRIKRHSHHSTEPHIYEMAGLWHEPGIGCFLDEYFLFPSLSRLRYDAGLLPSVVTGEGRIKEPAAARK